MSGKTRKRVLPAGWYPHSKGETAEILGEWKREHDEESSMERGSAFSAVVPHAGWGFSGKLAFRSILLLRPSCDTVVVVGGHMRPGEGVLAATEDAYETPFGAAEADGEYISALGKYLKKRNIDMWEDSVPDNTVEVNLPFVRYLFPESRVVWLRTGAGDESRELGRICREVASELDRELCVIGSTDLTHYGPGYGFTPAGTGEKAYRWVKEENDAAIVDAMVSMKSEDVIRLGNEEKAACSAGAAVAAIEFARENGVDRGSLVGYSSSYEVHPGSSFVGYAGIVY